MNYFGLIFELLKAFSVLISLWNCWLIVCIVIQHVSIASSDLGAQNMDHNFSVKFDLLPNFAWTVFVHFASSRLSSKMLHHWWWREEDLSAWQSLLQLVKIKLTTLRITYIDTNNVHRIICLNLLSDTWLFLILITWILITCTSR